MGHKISGEDFTLAGKLVCDFPSKLATADAIRLADSIAPGACLVTFDKRLTAAAIRNNAKVIEIPSL